MDGALHAHIRLSCCAGRLFGGTDAVTKPALPCPPLPSMPDGPVTQVSQRSLLADIRFPVYSLDVEWEIEGTDEFFAWTEALERSDAEARDMLDAVIDLLAERGPMMRRPYVGEIVTSRHHNMKELLVPAGAMELRVLFCFDPRRMAILLLGGDKSKDSLWNAWYEKAVPEADDLYDVYLAELRREGLLP